MTPEQEKTKTMIARYPVLPLRDIVVFPHMIVPLFVGREKSVRALEEVMSNDKKIILVAQKQAGDENPDIDELYTMATMGTVLQLLKLPDGAIKVLVEGGSRATSKISSIRTIILRLRSLSRKTILVKTTLKPMRLAVRRSSSLKITSS